MVAVMGYDYVGGVSSGSSCCVVDGVIVCGEGRGAVVVDGLGAG